MKEVIKKYPATKWADLAAFTLLDNKLCGDWKALRSVPTKSLRCMRNMRTTGRNLGCPRSAL